MICVFIIGSVLSKIWSFQSFGKKDEATDFHAIKNEFQCQYCIKIDGKFIYSIGRVNNTFKFFQIRSAYCAKWSSKLAHFLLSVTPKYLKILCKVILLTMI